MTTELDKHYDEAIGRIPNTARPEHDEGFSFDPSRLVSATPAHLQKRYDEDAGYLGGFVDYELEDAPDLDPLPLTATDRHRRNKAIRHAILALLLPCVPFLVGQCGERK